MASVRMSQELRREIASNARQAFIKTNPDPEMTTADIDWFVDKVRNCEAQETLARIRGLADDFPQMNSRRWNRDNQHCFEASFPHMQRTTAFYIDDRHIVDNQQVQFRLNKPVMLYTYDTDETLHFSTSCFSDADRIEAASRINAFIERKREHSVKAANYYNQIDNLVSHYTTLKSLLTAWPAGETFVPDRYVQKMHEKVTRKQAAEQIKEDLQFDEAAINQVVLTSKMMGV